MTRNLKVLGLALAAVFAFSAMTASGALAQGKLTSDGNVTLKGTLTGAELANSITAFSGQTVTCPKAIYTGHKTLTFTDTEGDPEKPKKTHELLPSGSTATTITPHYGVCSGSGLFPATVDMNGCDYEFDLKGETMHEGVAVFAITPTVECPSGKHIIVTLFKDAAAHTGNTPFCEIEVTEQTDYTNANLVARNTAGDVDITGTINDIVVHRRLTPGHSSIFCATKTDNAAILHIDATVKGLNGAGGDTNISISK